MPQYAKGTTVPKERTAGEIIALLRSGGAVQTMFFDGDSGMGIAWSAEDATYRIGVPKPAPKKDRYGKTEPASATAKEEDRRWRAMLLYVKAKLVAIDEGLVEYRQAFMAEIVASDGATLYETMKVQIASGNVPRSLPMPGGPG